MLEKKITPPEIDFSEALPLNEPSTSLLQWSLLNDSQKAHILLNSNRLPDYESFLSDFKSWEQPDTNSSNI